MVLQGCSARVFHDLNTILPNEGRRLIHHVDVPEDWGDIHYVTVFAGIHHHDAGAALERTIHTIISGVLNGRRHNVRIVWPEPV